MKKGRCYICNKHRLVENHHLIPQARGGKDGPQRHICVECHDKAHYLARGKVPLEEIINTKLRKVVQIIRIANATRPHSDKIKITVEMPMTLYNKIKEEADIGGKTKRSIPRTILAIIVKHFREK